jgi:glycosyltransferase involved in cell wall biosynthesis
MKVLMVAPRICTPWSEGRKKFFRDLCNEAVDRWQLTALITVDAGEHSDLPMPATTFVSKHAWQHLTHIRLNLRDVIREHQPDLICYLPFGEFSGLRGLANIWSIWSVERICKRLGVASCTLMYALTSEANTRFHRYALRHAYFNQHGAAARTVRFGVRLPEADHRFAPGIVRHERNILFMAGVAEESDERLNHVLDTRGLRFLLKAAVRLQADGYRLIVAVPLLRNESLLKKLVQDADNCWDPNSIEYCADLTMPEIYLRTHVFAFPYATEELQFVPTSIVEAMHFSVPVIVPKLTFLAQFYKPESRALVYEKDNPESFVEQLRIIDDRERLITLCTTAKKYVDNEYDIRNSVTDIEAISRRGADH